MMCTSVWLSLSLPLWHVGYHNRSRYNPCICSDLNSSEDRYVDPRLYPVAKNCAQFSLSAVHHPPFHSRPDVGIIELQIGSDRPGAQRHLVCDNTVPNITEVGNLGVVHDDTVLDLAACTDFRSFSKRGSRTEVGIRAHYCTLADVDGTLDVRARLHT